MIFSLIIPTYNRPESLKKCLDSVFASDFNNKDYEVIVIIDGNCKKSTYVTALYLKKYRHFKVFNQVPNKGPAAARNFGLKLANGEIIGFTDDDCILPKDWIRKMVEAHQKNKEAAVIGGDTYPPLNSMNIVVSQYISNSGIQFKVDGKLETLYFPTCNVSIKRSVAEKFFFNETFPFPGGEDLEFFWRIYKAGYKLLFDKNITLLHDRSSTLKAFIRQQYIYGRGNLLVYAYHREHPILKKILTLNYFLLLLKLLDCIFNVFSLSGWFYFACQIAQKYKIQGKGNIFKIFACLQIYRLCNIFGNIRELISIKIRALKMKNNLTQQLPE
jgi:glycosyltransferase involved in cell wall biosynthesis